jgi:hypothetical protein
MYNLLEQPRISARTAKLPDDPSFFLRALEDRRSAFGTVTTAGVSGRRP